MRCYHCSPRPWKYTKDAGRFYVCHFLRRCTCDEPRLPLPHFFFLSAVEMENVVWSVRAAKAGVEWRYQHSLLSTSPATGGSFIFPARLLSRPDNHEYGCIRRAGDCNGRNRRKTKKTQRCIHCGSNILGPYAYARPISVANVMNLMSR